MSVRSCGLLALAAALLGVGLRIGLPVTPADEAYRFVVHAYGAVPAP